MADWFDIGAGALGAVSNVATGLINNAFVKKENQRNRDWQEKMYDISVQNNRQDAETAFGHQQQLMDLQAQKQLELQEKQYAAQMKGIKESGMNPMFAMGMGGIQGVSAPSTPQASAAGAGSPQTFNPATMMDISASIKNMAEAGLATAKAKTEEGIQEKIQAEIKVYDQQIAESSARIKEINSKVELNNANTEALNISNRINSATEETQKEIKNQELLNLKQAWKKDFEIIKGLEIENDKKTEILANYIKEQKARIYKLNMEANGQKIQNQKMLKEYKRFDEILDASIRTAIAEADNAEDFKRRFAKEMEQRAAELKQKNKQMWINGVNDFIGNATRAVSAIMTAGISEVGANTMKGIYTTSSTF